jgi:DNA-binding FadR family transcriptional regulator
LLMAGCATPTGGEDPPTRPGPSPAAKRAERVADRIIDDVIALGWPVGTLLGSEAELLQRYGVSRAVFREAVRLVEHQQLARTRRGPGGGLVITEPSVAAVIDAVVLYLYRIKASLDELFEARIVLEEIVTSLAPGRLDDSGLTRLRPFLQAGDPDQNADPRALHALLASITRNPALELFVDVLSRVAMLYSMDWQALGPEIGAESAHAHARIAEAVIAADPALAGSRMRRHLQAERDYLYRLRSTTELLPDHAVLGESGDGKRAEAVARRITQHIVGRGMRPGALVGAERELIEQEGVSRAVLREAVRLLEHHQIARMRRGPGGGLFVFEPSAGAVTDIAAIYLARGGIRPDSLSESRTGVEVALVGLAAERIDPAGAARLREAIDSEPAADAPEQDGIAGDLHAAIARTARSRVLELVALVLIRLSRLHGIEQLTMQARRQAHADMLQAHEDIALAVQGGDCEVATRRMRRHLEALAAFLP